MRQINSRQKHLKIRIYIYLSRILYRKKVACLIEIKSVSLPQICINSTRVSATIKLKQKKWNQLLLQVHHRNQAGQHPPEVKQTQAKTLAISTPLASAKQQSRLPCRWRKQPRPNSTTWGRSSTSDWLPPLKKYLVFLRKPSSPTKKRWTVSASFWTWSANPPVIHTWQVCNAFSSTRQFVHTSAMIRLISNDFTRILIHILVQPTIPSNRNQI